MSPLISSVFLLQLHFIQISLLTERKQTFLWERCQKYFWDAFVKSHIMLKSPQSCHYSFSVLTFNHRKPIKKNLGAREADTAVCAVPGPEVQKGGQCWCCEQVLVVFSQIRPTVPVCLFTV